MAMFVAAVKSFDTMDENKFSNLVISFINELFERKWIINGKIYWIPCRVNNDSLVHQVIIGLSQEGQKNANYIEMEEWDINKYKVSSSAVYGFVLKS